MALAAALLLTVLAGLVEQPLWGQRAKPAAADSIELELELPALLVESHPAPAPAADPGWRSRPRPIIAAAPEILALYLAGHLSHSGRDSSSATALPPPSIA